MSRRSRFTDEFKKQIVALYKSGKRVADLAKDYEISKHQSINGLMSLKLLVHLE